MSTVRYLALATAAFSLASCSSFKKGGDENYDTVDGGNNQYDTSNPYGVPGDTSAEAAPYQPVNPPADANPTYGQAAYEDHGSTTPAPAASSGPSTSAPAHSAASTSHVVVKGDTLGAIARRYGTTSASIKQANGMTSDTVVLGKKLVIPGSSGPVKAATAPASGGGSSKVHVVVKGDSLSKIAAKHGTTSDAIKKANGMTSDTVVLGSKLRIP
ncbi:MAG: LysM peptidoglycan-binding domain-containing protein [Verrucomicrobiaceae bacterium]|nr:MAG: LysM peptidoglycan-binding domain-containing protein [Verrucomicrobiaceae bacterium]